MRSIVTSRRRFKLARKPGSGHTRSRLVYASNTCKCVFIDLGLFKDLNSPKSMNTHLHVLEAYTNLLRVWPDPGLRASLKRLLEVTMDRIVDNSTGHFKMFFENDWTSLTDHVSFGHDIEGSWLI